MIPTIGLIIGFYVITRMVSLFLRKHERAEPTVVKVLAVITIIVAVIGILDLLTRGSQ